jgi:hypothetical protein
MIHLLASLVLFFLFITSHVIGYRLRLIRFQPAALVFLCVAWAVAYAATLYLYPDFFLNNSRPMLLVPTLNLPISSFVLYGLLCLGYVAQAIAAEAGSPSMRVIDTIDRSPTKSITVVDAVNLFSNEELIHARLDDLVTHKHLRFDGKKYSILPRGSLIERTISGYRRLLNREVGG